MRQVRQWQKEPRPNRISTSFAPLNAALPRVPLTRMTVVGENGPEGLGRKEKPYKPNAYTLSSNDVTNKRPPSTVGAPNVKLPIVVPLLQSCAPVDASIAYTVLPIPLVKYATPFATTTCSLVSFWLEMPTLLCHASDNVQSG